MQQSRFGHLGVAVGVDPQKPAAQNSSAHVSFMDENNRILAAVTVSLSKPALPRTIALQGSQQLRVKCVSVYGPDPGEERLFDVFLGDPTLKP
jgi:hypothetical protein